jgi:hypothetical protein
MRWVALFSTVIALFPGTAASQTWTSTFVGDRGLAGDASFSDGVWTINGGGADVWDRVDAFQFLHQPATDHAYITTRVDDLQNTDPYAKSGVMVRASLDTSAAMVILDILPGGQLEFMARTSSGEAVTLIRRGAFSFPAWLRLSWYEDSVRAWVSHDGSNWSFFENAGVTLSSSFEAGVAVTSHDPVQLATAHVGDLAMTPDTMPGWSSTDVGDVGQVGSASETNGVWTVRGGGADIWGTSDGFHFVYRQTISDRQVLQVRVTDLENTSDFAKAGLMIRTGLDASAPTVLLDVRPTGDVEFMARAADGAEMQFLGGATVTLPAWLRLTWVEASPSYPTSPVNVTAFVSQDKVNWTAIGPTASIALPRQPGSPIPPDSSYPVGLVVSSHDVTRMNTAHFDGLSMMRWFWSSDDIGSTRFAGNAVNDPTVNSFPFIVSGAGAGISGTADSFQFMHVGPDPFTTGAIADRVDIHTTNSSAMAGFMYRDGLAPDAAMVMVGLKPDGNVEFIARLCTGCEVTHQAGATIGVPAWLQLERRYSTFSAWVRSADGSRRVDLGSVPVPMSVMIPGLAVTSQDASQIAVGIFSLQP